MSIGRTKEEQELTALLSATLVQKEVMEPMAKIGWTQGTPPPPDYSGRPAPAEGAPAVTPAPAAPVQDGLPGPAVSTKPDTAAQTDTSTDLYALYESMRDPVSGLIAGKYKTVPEAIKGSVHVVNMAKQSFQERDKALEELSKFRSGGSTLQPTPAPTGVAPTPQLSSASSRDAYTKAQADLDAVLSKILENGGVLEPETAKALSAAQSRLSDTAADVRVQENLNAHSQNAVKEKNEWDAVDNYMREKYPESVRFSDEVALHVSGDPLLAGAVDAYLKQGKRQEATELAWRSYERYTKDSMSAEDRAKAQATEDELAAREAVRKELQDKARKDAGIVGGSVGGAGAHEAPNAGGTQEEIEATLAAMRREGSAPGSAAAVRFRQLVIGPSLGFLNDPNR